MNLYPKFKFTRLYSHERLSQSEKVHVKYQGKKNGNEMNGNHPNTRVRETVGDQELLLYRTCLSVATAVGRERRCRSLLTKSQKEQGVEGCSTQAIGVPLREGRTSHHLRMQGQKQVKMGVVADKLTVEDTVQCHCVPNGLSHSLGLFEGIHRAGC